MAIERQQNRTSFGVLSSVAAAARGVMFGATPDAGTGEGADSSWKIKECVRMPEITISSPFLDMG